MSNYYYKNLENGKIYTNDSTITSVSTPKNCYIGFKISLDTTSGNAYSSNAGWFAIKDGNYPLYKPVYKDNTCTTIISADENGHLPIFACTVSSYNNLYNLIYNTDSTTTLNYPLNYVKPLDIPCLYGCEIGIKDFKFCYNENNNRTSWFLGNSRIPDPYVLTYYNYIGKGPTTAQFPDASGIYNASFLKTSSFKNVDFELNNSNVNDGDTPEKLSFKDKIYWINDINEWRDGVNLFEIKDHVNWSEHPYTREDESNPNIPPYFTLSISSIKQKYNKLKIACSGYFLYSDLSKQTITSQCTVDSSFATHDNFTVDNKPYVFQFLYQFDDLSSWNTAGNNYSTIYWNSGTSSTSGIYSSATTDSAYFNILMNGSNCKEYHYWNNKLYKHIIPYRIEDYINSALFAFTAEDKTTGYFIVKSTESANVNTGTNIKHVDFPSWNFTEGLALGNSAQPTQYDTIPSSWLPYDDTDNTGNYIPGCNYYAPYKISELTDTNKSKLKQVNWSDRYITGYSPSANLPYTFGQIERSLTIDLTNVSSNYIHISYPGTTIFNNVIPGEKNDSIMYQLVMSYEGIV